MNWEHKVSSGPNWNYLLVSSDVKKRLLNTDFCSTLGTKLDALAWYLRWFEVPLYQYLRTLNNIF